MVFAMLLAGCADADKDPYDVESLIRPPPKPPNCPPGPATDPSANDDVRVIQAATNRFYVPKEWVRGYFVDEALRHYSKAPRSVHPILGKFDPDLHATECPGVIHGYLGGRASAYGDFGFVVSNEGPSANVASQLARLGIERIFFKTNQSNPVPRTSDTSLKGFAGNQEVIGWQTLNSYEYADSTAPDTAGCVASAGNPRSELLVIRRLPTGSGLGVVVKASQTPPNDWRKLCAAIPSLYGWLTTKSDDRSTLNP